MKPHEFSKDAKGVRPKAILGVALSRTMGYYQRMVNPRTQRIAHEYNSAQDTVRIAICPLRDFTCVKSVLDLCKALQQYTIIPAMIETLHEYCSWVEPIQTSKHDSNIIPLKLNPAKLSEPAHVGHNSTLLLALLSFLDLPCPIERETKINGMTVLSIAQGLAEGIVASQSPSGSFSVYWEEMSDAGSEIHAAIALLALSQASITWKSSNAELSQRILYAAELAFRFYRESGIFESPIPMFSSSSECAASSSSFVPRGFSSHSSSSSSSTHSGSPGTSGSSPNALVSKISVMAHSDRNGHVGNHQIFLVNWCILGCVKLYRATLNEELTVCIPSIVWQMEDAVVRTGIFNIIKESPASIATLEVGCVLEGLCDAYFLLIEHMQEMHEQGAHETSEYAELLQRKAAYLKGIANSMKFLLKIQNQSNRGEGGFPNSVDNPIQRLDVTAHCMNSLLKLFHLLETRDFLPD